MHFTVTTTTIVHVLLLAAGVTILLSQLPAAVDGKLLPDMTIMSGPDCTGISPGRRYNDKVGHLINSFVLGTWRQARTGNGDRLFVHSWPNRNPGSVAGGAICYVDLGRDGCLACLFIARMKMYSGCHSSISGNITLQDCSIWFDMIR